MIQRGYPQEHPRAGRSPRRKVACIRPPSTEACFFHCRSSSRHTLANWPRREAPWPSLESRQGPTVILDPPTLLCRGNFSLSWLGFVSRFFFFFLSKESLRRILVVYFSSKNVRLVKELLFPFFLKRRILMKSMSIFVLR